MARMDRLIHDFLGSGRTASLATTDEHGRPHVINIIYAMDRRQRLYFVSNLETAHSRHIVRDPHVALALYGDVEEPLHIHGLQIHGVCSLIASPPEGDGAAWREAWRVYANRYPHLAQNPQFRQAVETQCFFRVTPTWIRWLDNRKGFGFKIEQKLAKHNGSPADKSSAKPAGRPKAGKSKSPLKPRIAKTKRAGDA